jgi:CRP-like cAMP-binding protein
VAIRERASTDPDELVRSAIEPTDQGGPPSMSQAPDDLGAIDRMLFLRRVPLFEGLAPEDLQRIAATARERAYGPDEVVVREGDVGDELIVILEGSVRIIRLDAGEERLVRRYGAGQHIGELAVLRDRPRAATVIAEEPGVRGLVIGGQGLRAILRERPEAAMAMLATLAERLSSS